MKLLPPGDKIIVKVTQEEQVTKGGIVIKINKDEEHPHDTLKGLVVFCGSECKIVKEGDIIYFEQRWSNPCELEDQKYKVIKEENILGVVKVCKCKGKEGGVCCKPSKLSVVA